MDGLEDLLEDLDTSAKQDDWDKMDLSSKPVVTKKAEPVVAKKEEEVDEWGDLGGTNKNLLTVLK